MISLHYSSVHLFHEAENVCIYDRKMYYKKCKIIKFIDGTGLKLNAKDYFDTDAKCLTQCDVCSTSWKGTLNS